MCLGISGNNQLAQMLSVWDCCCFPGGRLAPPVVSWVSLVVGLGPGGSEVGTGVQAIHLEVTLAWEQPLPGLPSPAVQTLDVGAPGSPGRVSVAAPGLGLAGHLLRGSRRGGGALVLGEHDTHPHPRNIPLLISSQVAAPSGCSAGGPGIQTPAPGRGAFIMSPALTGHLPRDVLAVVCIGLIGNGADRS